MADSASTPARRRWWSRPSKPLRLAVLLALLAGIVAFLAWQRWPAPASRDPRFVVSTFASGLERPWGAALLPDGRLLVTERPGRLRLVGIDGRVSAPLSGVPPVVARGQGGLLDIALAPDFATTREVFLCQAAQVEGGVLTRLVRARLLGDATGLEGARTVLDAAPGQAEGGLHFGCRIVFSRDGHVFLSTGERGTGPRSQALDDLAGKVLRLARDGAVPADNPFVGVAGARPEIWSYGHRNPQGLAMNPWTGSLWEAEFGARGGDEVNLVVPGRNYGWPLVSYGTGYDRRPIGTGQSSAPGIEEPLFHWTPSVSPSGMAFYDGQAFPDWRGSLFLAALNPPGLVRLTTAGDSVMGEERLLFEQGVRMRHVVVARNGSLLLLTDESRGRILRLSPR
jgi:glucose/arabinose dehydrogenase